MTAFPSATRVKKRAKRFERDWLGKGNKFKILSEGNKSMVSITLNRVSISNGLLHPIPYHMVKWLFSLINLPKDVSNKSLKCLMHKLSSYIMGQNKA